MQISAKRLEIAHVLGNTFQCCIVILFVPTKYIAVSISPQHKVILSTLEQKESLMRIESQVSEKSEQCVKLHNSVSHGISDSIIPAYTELGRFQSLN